MRVEFNPSRVSALEFTLLYSDVSKPLSADVVCCLFASKEKINSLNTHLFNTNQSSDKFNFQSEYKANN